MIITKSKQTEKTIYLIAKAAFPDREVTSIKELTDEILIIRNSGYV